MQHVAAMGVAQRSATICSGLCSSAWYGQSNAAQRNAGGFIEAADHAWSIGSICSSQEIMKQRPSRHRVCASHPISVMISWRGRQPVFGGRRRSAWFHCDCSRRYRNTCNTHWGYAPFRSGYCGSAGRNHSEIGQWGCRRFRRRQDYTGIVCFGPQVATIVAPTRKDTGSTLLRTKIAGLRPQTAGVWGIRGFGPLFIFRAHACACDQLYGFECGCISCRRHHQSARGGLWACVFVYGV